MWCRSPARVELAGPAQRPWDEGTCWLVWWEGLGGKDRRMVRGGRPGLLAVWRGGVFHSDPHLGRPPSGKLGPTGGLEEKQSSGRTKPTAH